MQADPESGEGEEVMPAKSKQQFKLMKGIVEGSIKPRKGLPSKKVAKEFIEGQSPKGLPKRKK